MAVAREPAAMTLLIIALAGLSTLPQARHVQTRHITKTEIAALVEAVQDEIYDHGFEDDYYQLGPNMGNDPKKWKSRVSIYIEPQIEDGERMRFTNTCTTAKYTGYLPSAKTA